MATSREERQKAEQDKYKAKVEHALQEIASAKTIYGVIEAVSYYGKEPEVIKAGLKALSELTSTCQPPSLSALSTCTDLVTAEVKAGDIDEQSVNGWTALISTARRGYLELLQWLLEHNADLTKTISPDPFPHTAISVALETMRHPHLTKEGIEIQAQCIELLFNAIERMESLDVRRAALGPILLLAVDPRYAAIRDRAIKLGADVNFTDQYGRTALHMVPREIQFHYFYGVFNDTKQVDEVVNALFAKGIKADIKDGYERLPSWNPTTPVEYANEQLRILNEHNRAGDMSGLISVLNHFVSRVQNYLQSQLQTSIGVPCDLPPVPRFTPEQILAEIYTTFPPAPKAKRGSILNEIENLFPSPNLKK